MRSVRGWLLMISASMLCSALVLGLLVSRWDARVSAGRATLAQVAARYPVGSREHAMAVRREMTRRRHPHWSDLSVAEIAARLEKMTLRALFRPHDGGTSTQPPFAPFLGDFTMISAPAGQTFMMARQSDCSLTYFGATYTVTNPSFNIVSTVPHYGSTLHQLAGLTSTPDLFPSGCTPYNGSQADAGYVGQSTQGLYTFAAKGYDPSTQNNTLYYATISSSYNFNAVGSNGSNPNVSGVVSGDLNKDGNGDLIELSDGNCSVSVLLGNSDGTFGTPTPYSCSGYSSIGAVVADFNGDGRLDVAVVTADGKVTVLLGAGTGALSQGQSYQITAPHASFGANLIVADIRGTGRKDIIVSSGDVLLSNGDGTFTAGTTIGLPGTSATSSYGPNLASADLNKDGKADLVYSDGYSIDIYLGNGDGTFTAGARYASIDNVGYVTIADLDGDGNLDIYSGLAGGPFFLGDQFENSEAYVLLGNGDGTFQGAPVAPVGYAGNNLGDVNGDGRLDLIGESVSSTDQSITFTAYLGQADGSFSPTGQALNVGTINVPNVTQGATTYSNLGLNTYFVADVNGDGRADLVFVPSAQTSYYERDILCVAFGNANGTFAQPTCSEMPSLLSNPGTLPTGGQDFDSGLVVNNLQVIDLNGDGKPDMFYSYLDNDYGAATTTQGFVMQPGNGDGTFGTPEVLQLSSGIGGSSAPLPQFALFGDFNGDGRPDLVTTQIEGSYPSDTTSVLLNLNNGDGTFKSSSTITTGVNSPELTSPILAADMNGDGKVDLVTYGDDSSGNGDLAVVLSNGDGTFAAPKLTAISGDVNGLAVGDFNGDSKIDVVALTYENVFSGIYFGNGDGTVRTMSDSYGGVIPDEVIPLNVNGPAIAHDFNGDGKLDVLANDVLLRSIAAPSVSSPGTATSSTSLSASPASATTGTAVTFSATVSGPSGTSTVPTGTVSFLDGTTSLGTGALSAAGVASLSTSSLAAGTHSITASYAGDSNFAASVSSAVSVTVTAPAPTFAVSASPSSGTVPSAGGMVTTTISVAPANGFASPTSLSCSGLPAFAACSFSPPTVTPGSAAATSTLTISTNVKTAAIGSTTSPRNSLGRGVMLASLGAAAFLLFRRRRVPIPPLVASLLLSATVLWLSSCSGSSSSRTPSGTTAVVITARGGSVTQSTTFSLTVQ